MKVLRAVGLERPARRHVLPKVHEWVDDLRELSPEQRARRNVKRVVRAAMLEDRRLVAGPWLSELGFEVLYWIPFLRWLQRSMKVSPERLVVVSRGGVESWYADVADDYLDILGHMTPDEFRALTEGRWRESGGQKQMAFGRWDAEALDAMGTALPWDPHALIHPSLMYRLFQPFWRGRAGLDHVLRHTDFRPFPQPDPGPWAGSLPDRYVAVKFYFRPSFPDTFDNRRRVNALVSGLAQEIPVVLLNTGLTVDDHVDVDPKVESNVIWLLRGVAPEDNLRAQSLAISRASAFVGTYGGLSYLAPSYGIPSIALYSNREHFLSSHLEVAQRAAAACGGALTVLGPEHQDLAELVGLLAAPESTAVAQ